MNSAERSDLATARSRQRWISVSPGDVILFKPQVWRTRWKWMLTRIVSDRNHRLDHSPIGFFDTREEGQIYAESLGLDFKVEDRTEIWTTMMLAQGGYSVEKAWEAEVRA